MLLADFFDEGMSSLVRRLPVRGTVPRSNMTRLALPVLLQFGGNG